MIAREDLVFATCRQLSAYILDDWEDCPDETKIALHCLRPIDEPDGTFVGGGLDSLLNTVELKMYEKEPEAISNRKKLVSLSLAVKLFRMTLRHADGWNTNDSDNLKKEILLRIKTYEDELKQISETKPAVCSIEP